MVGFENGCEHNFERGLLKKAKWLGKLDMKPLINAFSFLSKEEVDNKNKVSE